MKKIFNLFKKKVIKNKKDEFLQNNIRYSSFSSDIERLKKYLESNEDYNKLTPKHLKKILEDPPRFTGGIGGHYSK